MIDKILDKMRTLAGLTVLSDGYEETAKINKATKRTNAKKAKSAKVNGAVYKGKKSKAGTNKKSAKGKKTIKAKKASKKGMGMMPSGLSKKAKSNKAANGKKTIKAKKAARNYDSVIDNNTDDVKNTENTNNNPIANIFNSLPDSSYNPDMSTDQIKNYLDVVLNPKDYDGDESILEDGKTKILTHLNDGKRYVPLYKGKLDFIGYFDKLTGKFNSSSKDEFDKIKDEPLELKNVEKNSDKGGSNKALPMTLRGLIGGSKSDENKKKMKEVITKLIQAYEKKYGRFVRLYDKK